MGLLSQIRSFERTGTVFHPSIFRDSTLSIPFSLLFLVYSRVDSLITHFWLIFNKDLLIELVLLRQLQDENLADWENLHWASWISAGS